MLAGKPAAAREHCEAGLRLYDPERHSLQYQLYGGHDPGICGLGNSANAHWRLGYAETGLGIDREALSLAERIGHPFSLELALVQSATLHLRRGEPGLALQRLRAAEDLVAEQRLAFIQEPRFFRGTALAAQGALTEAVACLREGLASPLGGRLFGLAGLAEVLTRQGEHGQALAAVKEGLKVQERTGQRAFEAELHRLEGLALWGLNRLEEGQIALEEALRVARRQQAMAYELRAATSLARLWGEQGRRGEARDLLAPVYSWFTEGFDTADLKETRGLLDELM
jgi:predicted ATPase